MDFRTRSASLVFAAVVAAVPTLGRAADFTFTSQSGNWSTASNWLNGLVPVNDPATNVIIKGSSTAALTSLIDASQPIWAINGLTLNHGGSQTTADVVTIDPSSTLQFVGPGAFINQASGTPTTINGAINLATNLNIISTGTAAVTLAGAISGSGGIIYSTTNAPLTLAGNNTFSGGLTIAPTSSSFNTVVLGSPSALGTGNLTVITPGGSNLPAIAIGIGAASGTSTTITNNIVINNSLDSHPTTNNISFFGNNTPLNYTNFLQHVVINGDTNLGFTQLGHLGATPTWDIQSLTLNGNLTVSSGNVTLDAFSAAAPYSLTVSANLPGALTLTGANNYSGGTFINGGSLNANASGALGSGPITVQGVLHLNATNAAQTPISGAGTVYYAANGAAGGLLVNVSNLILDNSVSSFSNGVSSDTFNIGNGTVAGNSETLGLLDRGVGSGTTPNFFASAGAQIENTDGGLPAVQNLGTNADLIPVVHTTAPLTVAIGTGTPWGGLSGGATQAFLGTVVANSNFSLVGGLLGNGTPGSFNIVSPSPGGSSVVVSVQNVNIASPLSDFSGAARLDVEGTLTLNSANALGGGNGTSPVPVNVIGTLLVDNPAGINANVTLQSGSTLEINSVGLSGGGMINRTPGPLTLALDNASALTGTQTNGNFLQAGDLVRLNVNNIVGLKNLGADLNYILSGNKAQQQAEGFNIDGGSLFFVNPEESLVAGPAAQGDSTIHIGANGATITAFGTYVEPLNLHAWDSAIAVPILAAGTVNFGYTANAPSNTSGAVILTSTSNQFGMVNINNMTLVATAPATLSGAAITLNGGQLVLLSNTTNPSLPPTAYNNSVTVAENSTISDNITNIASIFPAPTGNHPILLPTVNLGSAILTVNSNSMAFNTLNLVGNGTIQSSDMPLTISSISDDGGSRNLTIMTGGVILQNSLTSSAPIGVVNSTLEFDGSSTPSISPLSIGNDSTLGGVGTVHRPVEFLSGIAGVSELSPGKSLTAAFPITGYTAGTLTLDSLVLSSATTLLWNLGTPGALGGTTNDLVIDNGDLTLAGTLIISNTAAFGGAGTYTLFTYGGTLTDDGLAVYPTFPDFSYAVDLSTPGEVNLVVSAAPEPATLAMGVPAAVILLRRRRR